MTARIIGPGIAWQAHTTTEFPVPVDPKYTKPDRDSPYVTGSWHNQAHLTLETSSPARDFTVFAVLWPERGARPAELDAELSTDGTLTIRRPDGRTDRVKLDDDALSVK